MTWTEFFWGLIFVPTFGLWMRSITNHNNRWHLYEWLFSTLLLIVWLVAVVHLF